MITLINRLRTNHYNVNELLARKGIVESARCECGNEIESIQHVIWWCSRYDEARARLDIELRKIGNTVEIDINKSIKEKDWLTLCHIVGRIDGRHFLSHPEVTTKKKKIEQSFRIE